MFRRHHVGSSSAAASGFQVMTTPTRCRGSGWIRQVSLYMWAEPDCNTVMFGINAFFGGGGDPIKAPTSFWLFFSSPATVLKTVETVDLATPVLLHGPFHFNRHFSPWHVSLIKIFYLFLILNDYIFKWTWTNHRMMDSFLGGDSFRNVVMLHVTSRVFCTGSNPKDVD